MWFTVMAGAGCSCDDSDRLARLAPEVFVYDPAVAPDERPADTLTTFDFGSVPLGATELRALGIRNVGTAVLSVCIEGTRLESCRPITGFEPADAPFSIQFDNPDAETGNWLLPEGSEREVAVRFSPNAEGVHTAELVLSHNASSEQTRVAVTGEGVAPAVQLSADELDFGPVTVGQREILRLTVENRTSFVQPIRTEPFLQGAVVFGVADATGREIAYDQSLVADLPPNGILSFEVWFQPPEEGAHENTLSVSFCPTCIATIDVRGRGVKPVFLLEPPTLSFGDVPEGEMATRTFEIVNVGSVDLEIRSVGIERGTSEEFAGQLMDDPDLPIMLAPTERRTVEVEYTASTPGEDAGRIEVVTDAWEDTTGEASSSPVGYVSVSARSVGPDINPFPPRLTFGVVAIDGRQEKVMAIQNAGNAPLTIFDLQLNASADLQLLARPELPAMVEPGRSLDLDVVFTPSDAGVDEGLIVISSDDRDEPTVEVEISGVGGVPTTCSIGVAPSQVTFGLVERGRRAVLPVEIRNAGAQPCTVTQLALAGAAEFTLANSVPAEITVSPGAVHRVPVAYQPTDYGDHTTALSFGSDDPGQPQVRVPISGSSAQSSVLVVPSSIDFNVVPVTCWSPRRQVTIYNTGSSAVTVANVYLDSSTTPEFDLVRVNTPLTINGGQSAIVDLFYRPADIGQDTGVLFIAHSEAPVPVAVPLAGNGQITPTVTDTFQQLPTPQADVLFVVDDSGSMSEEQRNLGSNLTAFLSFAQQQGIDYHIAVTTTDVTRSGEQGRFVPLMGSVSDRIITPQTSNPSVAFQRNTNVGTGGSGTERGLEAAYLALSDPLINTHNANFLRPSAALAVVFVSDEPDSSSRPVSFYENFLRNIKGFQNTAMLSSSAVVGTTAPRCSSPDGRAVYAPRYIAVANNTGGVVESICSANWGQTLTNIGRNSFGLRRQFTLSSQPVPQTVAVAIDGTAVISVDATGQVNWTYESASNVVSFAETSAPPAGSTITVTYTVACLSRL